MKFYFLETTSLWERHFSDSRFQDYDGDGGDGGGDVDVDDDDDD